MKNELKILVDKGIIELKDGLRLTEIKKKFSWILVADIKNAILGKRGCDDIIWYEGIWKNGVWEYGIWKSGTWKNGIWKSGIWESGIWENGVWENGTWEKGKWITGNWKIGVGINGTIYTDSPPKK